YSRVIHHAPELLRRLERGDELARHLDRLVRLGVARHAGGALPYAERAEAAELDGAPGLERVHHGDDEAVHDGLRLQLRQARSLGDAVYDVGFGHGTAGSWRGARESGRVRTTAWWRHARADHFTRCFNKIALTTGTAPSGSIRRQCSCNRLRFGPPRHSGLAGPRPEGSLPPLVHDADLMSRSRRALLCFAVLLAPSALAQQAADWQQEVAYEMDVHLAADRHQMTGTQRLAYTNNSP